MADDPDEHEEPMDDDPFAVFDEWASKADQRVYVDLQGPSQASVGVVAP